MADRDEIDEVRRRADFVSIVEQYVTLRRAGSNLKGLCPFHNEKTPSFHINPSQGIWTCFGECHESGDVFKFLQKIENLTFAEALERLALRTGVTLTRGRSGDGGQPAQRAGEKDRIYRTNALALKYFKDTLHRFPEAQKYIETRGISAASAASFQLGFASDAWDGLAVYLGNEGVAVADAESAGLIGRSDRGSLYDRMRGRVVFPIFDVQERPIGFGGRLMGEAREGQPKYWNSPETPVFLKRSILYGLWRARKAIAATGQAIVVEGYTDVIAAHQAGLENVVATLGTSLTEDHVKTLARLAPKVVLAFDADSAGLKAAFRASEIFDAHDMEAGVLELPQGEDPDSMLRQGRREEFEEAIAAAMPMAEYRIRRLIRLGPGESETDRLDLLKKAMPVLADVSSVIERERYINLLAPYHPQSSLGSGLAASQIRQDVRIFLETRSGRPSENRPADPVRDTAVPAFRSSVDLAEGHLIRALYSGERPLALLVREGINAEELPSQEAKLLAAGAYKVLDAGAQPEISSILGGEEAGTEIHWAVSVLLDDAEPLSQALVEEDIRFLKTRARQTRRELLSNLISDGKGDEASQRELIRLTAELKGSRSTPSIAASSRKPND